MIRRLLWSLVGVVALAAQVSAGQPLEDRSRLHVYAACADRVVVGRVHSPESKPVKVKPVPGVSHEITYHLFRLSSTETFAGGKAVTEVRIGGFLGDGKRAPVVPDTTPVPNPFVEDAEGLFFLQLHYSGEFYFVEKFVPKQDGKLLDDDLKAAKRYLGLLANPLASLRSKEPSDRLTSAVLLLTRYQYRTTGFLTTETQPIPADENKLILAALAEANWETDSPVHPWEVAHHLWQSSGGKPGQVVKSPVLPKGTPAEQSAFLRDWVQKNLDTYRIERRYK